MDQEKEVVLDDQTTGDETPASDDIGDSSTPKSGIQTRIDTLTRKRREAERDASYWKGVAEGSASTAPEKAKVEEVETLDPNNFNSDAEYLKAVAKQTREDILREVEKDREAENQKTQAQAAAKILAVAREKYADFDSVALNTSVKISQPMYDAAFGDNLGEVLYFLGSNPSEADRISLLTPIQQAKEIGKIELQVLKTPGKKETNAPTPPTTIDGGLKNPPKKADAEKSRAELRAEWDAKRRREAGLS